MAGDGPRRGGGQQGTPPSPPPQQTQPTTLNQNQQSAYDLMAQTLRSWGLTSLLGDLRQLIVKGDTNPNTLALELSQTKAYKARFDPVNGPRRAAGLPELRPGDIVAAEEQYRQVMKAYGLPPGFYSDRTSVDKLLANDVSPDELKARVQIAHDQYMAAPDYVKQLWSQYFGTKGDMIAAILDPNTATQLIQDRAQQVEIGGAGAQYGINVSQKRAQQFQEAGVTIAGARQAYQQIATSMPTDQSIAKRFGTQFTQADEENDLVLGDTQAAQKRKTLYSEEEALFNGNEASANADTLGVSQSY